MYILYQRCNHGEIFGATSAMLGQNLPPLDGIGLRAKATENLAATAVAPVAPAVTSLTLRLKWLKKELFFQPTLQANCSGNKRI